MAGTNDGATRTTPVFIIGAGPAGLSIAAQLRRRGIDAVTADRYGAAGSWLRMPEALRLVSPWWTNALAWRDVFDFYPFSTVAATDYAAYLQRFARRHGIAVHDGVRVSALQPGNPDGYEIATDAGRWHAAAVVVASGYFQAPRAPEPPYADDGTVPTWHAAAIPPAQQLVALAQARGAAPVVVLGKRISAGQIALALHDAGCRVHLSCRQPLQFRLDGLRGATKDFIYYFWEELRLRLQPRLTAASFPIMDGGRVRQLVEDGSITCGGPIQSVADGSVTTTTGRMAASAIIQATGYSPALDFLAPLLGAVATPPPCTDWQVDGHPGLFLLGMDNCMNYRSRTLRGIRHDAVHVAERVARHLKSN